MDDYTLLHGDCLEEMAAMDAGSVDAVVTDPPYGLHFMGKTWDSFGGPLGVDHKTTTERSGSMHAGRYDHRRDGEFQDFMFAAATECMRVLKPSSYLLMTGGTRTWHRLACAIEDAGFEIRDTLMWLYGSGFPKGKSCLKPAWEPIILARKPGPMRELGIEECRIEGAWATKFGNVRDDMRGGNYASGNGKKGITEDSECNPSGRWPANIVLDEEAGAMLDGQTGTLTSGKVNGLFVGEVEQSVALGDKRAMIRPASVHGDSGGASRFFYCPRASRSERNKGLEGMDAVDCGTMQDDSYKWEHDGKGNKIDLRTRAANHHPTVKPVALMRWLVRLVARPGDVVLDPFMGSGTTGVACIEDGREFIGIEREAEYVEIARRRIEHASAQGRLKV